MSVSVNTTGGTRVSVSVNGTNAVSFTTEETTLNLTEAGAITVSVTEKGPKGDVGATGPAGADGPAGPGLVSGGTENQFIQKNSATDYDTKWSAYTLPAADGADGQVLTTNGSATVTFAYPKTIAEDVKNVSGGPLLKGTPVHVTGSVGNLAEVIAADAATNYPAHFVLNEDLADDQEGLGIAIGFINNVDVPDASIYTEGQTVYLGESGGWTTTKPTGANAIQNLGIIIKVNTSGNKISGIIMGAGRANDVPNIATGNIWAGNADGVATATSVAYIDTANQRVGIGTVTPSLPLHVHLTSSQDTSPSAWYSNGIAVSSPNTYGIRRIGFEGPSRTTGAYIESSAESGSGGQRSYISFTTRAASVSEKMRITSDGNVGIGTSSPNKQLTFHEGVTNLYTSLDSRGIYFSRSSDGSYTGSIVADNGGNPSYSARNSHGFRINNEVTLVVGENPNISGSGAVSIGADSAATYQKQSVLSVGGGVAIGSSTTFNRAATSDGLLVEGNVGIGTTSPSDKLHVSGSIRVDTGDRISLGGSGLSMFHSGTYAEIANYTGDFIIRNTAANEDIIFKAEAGTGSDVEIMRIDGSSGNVGIGTSSPTQKLHVVGDKLLLEKSGANDAYIESKTTNAGAYFTANSEGAANYYGLELKYGTTGKWFIGSYGTSGLEFVNGAKSTGTRALFISSSNNVGIGTTSPTAKLHSMAADGNAFSLRIGRADTGSEWSFNHAGDDLRIYNQGGSGKDILLGVNSGGVDQGNKVGIGTAVPSAKLDVVGLANINDGSDNVMISSGNTALTTGTNNTAVGYQAGINNTEGIENVFFGRNSGFSTTTGSNNSFIAGYAGNSNTTGSNNTAVGWAASYSNTTGFSNTAVGRNALYNSTGNFNVAVGRDTALGGAGASFSNTVAVGYQALYDLTSGAGNTAVGYQASTNINSGNNNTSVGYQAGYAITSGSSNSFFGTYAGVNTTGSNNTALGHSANFYNTTGSNNVAIGRSAAFGASGASTFSNTVAVGYSALNALTTGSSNSAVGYNTLKSATSASYNTAFGSNALESNLIGSSNSAFGTEALRYNTGANNTAFGTASLRSKTSGDNNSAFGVNALYNNLTGSNNIAVGRNSGYYTTGSNNALIGYYAGHGASGASTFSNAVALGYQSLYSLTTGANNTAVGMTSGFSNTDGSQNSFFGRHAGYYSTGNSNVLIGYEAGYGSATSAYSNTVAIGQQALHDLTTGDHNTAVGLAASNKITTGGYNVSLGNYALRQNQISSGNTALGYGAAYESTNGNNSIVGYLAGYYGNQHNVALGARAMNYSTGSNNIAIGSAAAQGVYGVSNYSNTVAVGYRALYNLTTGAGNTAVGYLANNSLTSGSSNVSLGYEALNQTQGGNNNIAIGRAALNNNVGGGQNVAIGRTAGYSSLSSGNVFLGYASGYYETGGNKLYIANSDTTTPLIYGEFDNEILNVNGKLKPNSITVDDEGLSAAGDYGPGAEIWYQGTSTPSAGFCYYLDSTGGWTAAQANASGTATGMLAVSAGTDSDVDGMVLRGFVQISNTLTGSVGDAVYLETSAAGRFTTTKPTGAGNFVRRVGYLAKGTNVIYFNPSPEWEAL